MDELRECNQCGGMKQVSEFRRNHRMPDGRLKQCKDCRLDTERKWKRENPDKVREKRRRYHKRHPEKKAARAAVREAVQKGRLPKPSSCEDCGELVSGGELQAHHDDYSKPLEVEWLCRQCHNAWHLEASR